MRMTRRAAIHGSGGWFSPILNENSWARIAQAAAAGEASTIWNVGATKNVLLNGTSYAVRIIGFNHDTLSTADAAYNGGLRKAAITFQMVRVHNTAVPFNTQNTNGWRDSAMRVNTLRGTMWGYLPAELQAAIRAVNKITSQGMQGTTLLTTSDTLFLPSQREVFGTDVGVVPGEGAQYAYFADGGGTIKTRAGTAAAWWLRSPRSDNNQSTRMVTAAGTGSYDSSSTTTGRYMAFGFCV